MKLTKEELQKINGGGVSIGIIALAIGAFVTFVAGFLDGFVRPQSCNE